MFNPRTALSQLNGKSFNYSKLRVELKKIRFKHIDEVPPEFSTGDLFILALRSKWLTETEQGRFKIYVEEVGVEE